MHPATRLLVTSMPDTEVVSRADYQRLIASAVKDFLEDEGLDNVRCLVLMHGVPLTVSPPEVGPDAERMTRMIADERRYRVQRLDRTFAELSVIGTDQPIPEAAMLRTDVELTPERIEIIRRALEQAFESSAERIWALPASERQPVARRWLELWRQSVAHAADPSSLIDLPSVDQAPAEERRARQTELQAMLQRELDSRSLLGIFERMAELDGDLGALILAQSLADRTTPDATWTASVDSELATLFWPAVSLAGPVRNPLQRHFTGEAPGRTLMVCRLDGPDVDTVRRMIDDTIATERQGLKGRVYIDSRGRQGDDAYGEYDQDLRRLAELFREKTSLSVVLDEREGLFAEGDCPEAALYVGWYSMGRYVDAFDFVPGAVAWHIASTEAVHLRRPGSTLWCPSLLRDGVAATLGPVGEPYLTAFPRATEFFGMLATGATLGDSYFRTLPHLSWMMTLIGDPLYRPFAVDPPLSIDDLRAATDKEREPVAGRPHRNDRSQTG